MANIAGVGDFQCIGLGRGHEMEGVTTDIHIRNRLLDFRHVTGDALTSGTPLFVMSVSFDRNRMRTVLRMRAVAGQAHFAGGSS